MVDDDPVASPPAWASRPAPAPLAIVQQFVNTHAYSGRPDALATAAAAKRWLAAHSYRGSVTTRQLADLVALREGLRAELSEHAGHHLERPSPAARLLRDARLATSEDVHGSFALTGTGSGVTRLVGDIAAARATAILTARWERLKVCAADECRVAFWDVSRNVSARYCTAARCANRARQRAFRERAREAAAT